MGIERRSGKLGDLRTIQPQGEKKSLSAEEIVLIHAKQVNRLIELGIPQLIGMSETEYRAGLPNMLSQPEAYRGQFDIPLLVDPRIALPQLCQAVGIEYYNHDTSNQDLVAVPDKPYTMWTHDATPYRGVSVGKLFNYKGSNIPEIPSSLHEVVALYIHYPEIFEPLAIVAPGSRNSSNNVPYIGVIKGDAFIYDIGLTADDPIWGLLTRGEEINVGV